MHEVSLSRLIAQRGRGQHPSFPGSSESCPYWHREGLRKPLMQCSPLFRLHFQKSQFLSSPIVQSINRRFQKIHSFKLHTLLSKGMKSRTIPCLPFLHRCEPFFCSDPCCARCPLFRHLATILVIRAPGATVTLLPIYGYCVIQHHKSGMRLGFGTYPLQGMAVR